MTSKGPFQPKTFYDSMIFQPKTFYDSMILLQTTKLPRHTEKLPGVEIVHVVLHCPLEWCGSKKGYVKIPPKSEEDSFRVGNAQQNC